MIRKGKQSDGPKPHGKASTADILGPHSSNGKAPAKWGIQQAELLRLRDSLASQRRDRTASAQAEPAVVGVHMADTATDSYDRDWALAMASSDQSMLYEVNEALNRIANGSYGICEITGKPIEADRLKALPWTHFCAAAQAELEHRGAADRTRLGQRGAYDGVPGSDSSTDEDDLEEVAEGRQAA